MKSEKLKQNKISELVDILDLNGNKVGICSREEAHQDPTKIHAVCDCWLFNEKGEVLIQLQSDRKYPPKGRYDKSCGGHIEYGDNADNTCYRELEEELGLTRKNLKQQFTLVEKYIDSTKNKTHLIYLYFSFISSHTKFVLEKSSIKEVRWMSLDRAIELFETEEEIDTSKSGLKQLKKLRAYFNSTDFVVLRDLPTLKLRQTGNK